NLPEVTEAIKPVLGEYYYCDSTPTLYALWRSFTQCKFIESTGDVVFFKNMRGEAVRKRSAVVGGEKAGELAGRYRRAGDVRGMRAYGWHKGDTQRCPPVHGCYYYRLPLHALYQRAPFTHVVGLQRCLALWPRDRRVSVQIIARLSALVSYIAVEQDRHETQRKSKAAETQQKSKAAAHPARKLPSTHSTRQSGIPVFFKMAANATEE
ncbi:hypothetical protein EVJ58_g7672, partial [Rhodofomes roseus]